MYVVRGVKHDQQLCEEHASHGHTDTLMDKTIHCLYVRTLSGGGVVHRHQRTEVVDHHTFYRCPLSLSCTLDPLLPPTLLHFPLLSSTTSTLLYALHSPLLPSTLLYSSPLSSTPLYSPPLSSTLSTLLSSPAMHDYLPVKVRKWSEMLAFLNQACYTTQA